MFTNKHVIAALLITPVLAILGYFMVDSIVSEKPHKAKPGAHYQLVAKPNCRYSSGVCSFKNGEFEANITIDQTPSHTVINIVSDFALDGGQVSFSYDDVNATPVELYASNANNTHWQASFVHDYSGKETLRLVLAASGAMYYGETHAAFGEYKTSYGKDFRQP